MVSFLYVCVNVAAFINGIARSQSFRHSVVLYMMMEAHRIVSAVVDFFTQCASLPTSEKYTNMYDQKCTNLSALFVQRSIFMFIFNTGDS